MSRWAPFYVANPWRDGFVPTCDWGPAMQVQKPRDPAPVLISDFKPDAMSDYIETRVLPLRHFRLGEYVEDPDFYVYIADDDERWAQLRLFLFLAGRLLPFFEIAITLTPQYRRAADSLQRLRELNRRLGAR